MKKATGFFAQNWVKMASILVLFPVIIFYVYNYGAFKAIDETTLYYFFSSVAQTIGALLGVVGAFSIFKIQRLEQELLDLIIKFYQNLERSRIDSGPYATVLRRLFDSIMDDAKNRNIKEIVEKTQKSFAEIEEDAFVDLKNEFRDIKIKYDYRKGIVERLLNVTVLGTSLILLALISLLFTKTLIFNVEMLYMTTVLSCLMLVGTLFLFYQLIEKLIK